MGSDRLTIDHSPSLSRRPCSPTSVTPTRGSSSRLPVSAVVVVVLALGIGANTAIFSIVYGVRAEAAAVRAIRRGCSRCETTTRGEPDDIAYLDLKDWAAQSKTIDQHGGLRRDRGRR